MTSIVKANENDSRLLSEIAKITFIESHGNSAKPEDINNYLAEKYSDDILKKELQDLKNFYYILYYKDEVAGYSKIIPNSPYSNSEAKDIAKLERLYLLKEFYNLNLGLELLELNINLAKEHKQLGIWLFVWEENHRAINFYKKNGFIIISRYYFKISERHSNPNHLMFLSFK
jgi:ribosomal protein S18 acetylase RimI-like enzyme